MAAYAAVVSLEHTINGLLNSSSSPPRVSPIRDILESAFKEASSLVQVLEGLNGSNRSRSSMERVDALEAQIRDSAHKLEDVLELHQLMLQQEDEDEGEMRQEIRSFGEAAKRIGKEYLAELAREEGDDDDNGDKDKTGSSYTDFGVEMIGRSRLFDTILNENVLRRMRPDDTCLYAFTGEEGSGARLVVKNVFENARQAECRGWVRVGTRYVLKHVLMNLIAQVVEADVDDESLADASEDRLSECLYKALENRRYMIVLDDVDDVELLDYLRIKSFPDQSNGSVVLVITIAQPVVLSADFWFNYIIDDAYEEDIWLIIRHNVFGWESISAELEVAGKEIARNCRRLFISLAKTLVFLSKSDRTVEQWSELASQKENPIFTVADEILETSEIEKELHHCGTDIAREVLEFVSFSSRVENVNMMMYPERFFSRMQIISFFGMAGIGKTTFVENIFKDESNRFEHRVWIHTGPRYQTREILLDILTQIRHDIPKLHMEGDEKLVRDLCAQLSNERCLVVLDDLCSQGPLHHLREIFSTIRGTMLVTTRLPKVAKFERDDTTIELQLLGKEASWCLLCRKVFDGGLCPLN